MILLIDDDEQMSEILGVSLGSDGYEVRSFLSGQEALAAFSRDLFSLVLLDLRLGDCNGLDLLPRLREIDPDVPIFIITAHGDMESAIQAFTSGADGYIRKPFQEGEIRAQIAQATEQYRARREVRHRRGLQPGAGVRSLLRSRDACMEDVIRRVEIAARVSSNAVITGESGTGKELIARSLHSCGPRGGGPFVAFNCAAIPESLIEAELFGHARGAFTDARESRPGLFARANGGTLFLDEIAETSLSAQAKLLRALQEREITPIGGRAPMTLDVRVVAATNKSLREEVAAGRFRADLFYRLHVLPIHVPPLRERPNDIVYLATLFATRLAEELGLRFDGFTPAASAALQAHPWPGNVRELQNCVEHAMVMGGGGRLTAQLLFPDLEEEEVVVEADAGRPLPSFGDAKRSFERGYLERLLQLTSGNIARAARLARKSRTEVYGLLRKHGLSPRPFKASGEEIAGS